MFNAVIFQDLRLIVPKGKDNAFWKRLERKKKTNKKIEEGSVFLVECTSLIVGNNYLQILKRGDVCLDFCNRIENFRYYG